jgi:serine/threonine protein phosphatase PrpC
MTVELDIGRRTDIGRRREHNEDCLGIYHHPEFRDEVETRGTLLIVADGMGGYAAGEIASRTAVEAILNAYYGDLSDTMAEGLTRAVRYANRAVLDEANRDAERAGMGTTLALAVVWSGQLAVANVGDSRVYLIRDGRIAQISRDHSWIAELLAVGKITPEEARHHPMRNVVTRSLGGRPDLDIEVYPPLKLRRGDIALVCSDGLWGMVSAEQMLQTVESRSAQAAADALVAAANEAGGHDNITAIVCRVVSAVDEEASDQTTQMDALRLQDTQPIPIVP